VSLRRVLAHPGVMVAGLALAASASGLANGFVYDDIPIIQQNPIVRQPESIGRIWSTPYWPAGLLYRPVTVQLFAAEWALGGGSPLVFHLVSVLLKVLTAVLLWRLARRLLPPLPALAAAALFAVHPVHAESVANVVGQAELLAAGLALLAVERYLAWRERGSLGTGHRAALALLTLLAILTKETGVIIPALVVAAELILVAPALPWRKHVSHLAPVLALQSGAVVIAILARIIVLGPTPGAGPAVALQGLSPGERIAAMLAVVPHWARLLLWPAHLEAEYGPPGIAVTGPLRMAHLVGLLLLGGFVFLLIRTWRRQPMVAFGLAWVGLALFPVSNVLTTTGVILAERTLFLPSAGAMLALGGGLALLFPRLETARRPVRITGYALLAVLVLAGTLRSMARQPVWKEPDGFVRRLESDSPTSYRAHLIASRHYSETGRHLEAERAGARAYALFRDDPQVHEQYGQTLRRQGRCAEAMRVFSEAVERFPDRTVARSRLIECALDVGDTVRAREVAKEAVRLGQPEFERTVARLSGQVPRPTARRP
jgi:hypothetical protein